MSLDIVISLASTIIAAAATGAAGLTATWISNRLRKEKTAKEREIDKIAASVRSEHDLARIQEILEHTRDQTQVIALKAIIPAITAAQQRSPAVEDLISGYHEQALNQARAQFWFSVAAATVGFAWILYTGNQIQAENLATAFKTFPGVVMDAVAFLFFKQASETRQRATDLYDRLRKDKQIAESVVLVATIDDSRVRSAVKAQVALHMAGLEPRPIDLTQFLSSPEGPRQQDTSQNIAPPSATGGGPADTLTPRGS